MGDPETLRPSRECDVCGVDGSPLGEPRQGRLDQGLDLVASLIDELAYPWALLRAEGSHAPQEARQPALLAEHLAPHSLDGVG